jgi:AraC-like DNA-binding protein
MLFLPRSFVAAILMALATLRVWRARRATGPLLPALLLVLTFLAVLQGLRWGYGVKSLMPLQVALAMAGPPLAYLALARLGEPLRGADLRHAAAPLLAFVAGQIWPVLNDVLIPALALVYAALVARLALRGADGLPGARLSDGVTAERALWACAAGLAISGLTDAAVGLDFALTGGLRAGAMVTAAQCLGLLLAATAIGLAGRSAPEPEAAEPEPALSASEDERALVARLERLVRDQQLHKQPDLTLNRLARRALVPARQVSQAINRVRGESVSRFLNGVRVEEACRLLATTDEPVTQVMLSAGFQTKSNFNRAFKEATGMGPAEWRQSRREAAKSVGGDEAGPAVLKIGRRGQG